MAEDFVLFAGTANPVLAESIAYQLGVPLAARYVERFPDGEVSLHLAASVRRKQVFLIQPTSPPVDQHLMELLAFVDACRRGAAGRVTAVVPYFGYARADKRLGRREPIMARVVADLLHSVGIDHLVAVDLHTPQIEGFFRVPVDSLTAVPTLCGNLAERLPEGTVVVAPDAGRVGVATAYANRLGAPVVVLLKQRESGTETRVTHVVGEVRDRPCLIVDDMIATGGTIVESIAALLNAGAKPEITVAATHGLLVGDARDRLRHPAIRTVLVTDTVPLDECEGLPLRVVSVAPLVAGAIRRLLAAGSLSDVF
jgi:ribose-phosphate pyrophosphokinase